MKKSSATIMAAALMLASSCTEVKQEGQGYEPIIGKQEVTIKPTTNIKKKTNPLFIFLYHLISQTIYKYEPKDSFTHITIKFILSPDPNTPRNAAGEYCTTVLSHLLAKS